jgi:hypothetical protein
MVNDIASCLGVTPEFAGACAPETDLADKYRRNRLLRNV